MNEYYDNHKRFSVKNNENEMKKTNDDDYVMYTKTTIKYIYISNILFCFCKFYFTKNKKEKMIREM